MGWVIVLICAAALMYWVAKKNSPNRPKEKPAPVIASTPPIPRPTPGVNKIPADALINSPYYQKYKQVFDLIWYDGKQPKYKIDWLLESLDMGRELESQGNYLLDSMNANLPYFCETELEYLLFFDEGKPILIGFVDGIMDMISRYTYTDIHPSKQKYWKQTLLEMAIAGNLEAQGALCKIPPDDKAFSDQERSDFKAKYEVALQKLAEEGNPYAQLAVGKYLAPYASEETIDWFTKAANQGLGDAWYYLGNAYGRTINVDRAGKFRETPLQGEEEKKWSNLRDECWFRAANSDNGIMVGYCQWWTGTNYEDGDSIFPKDLEKAKFWYQKASENGSKHGKYRLQHLNEHPEWF